MCHHASLNESGCKVVTDLSGELNIVDAAIDLDSFLETGESLLKLLGYRPEKRRNATWHKFIASEICRAGSNKELPMVANQSSRVAEKPERNTRSNPC